MIYFILPKTNLTFTNIQCIADTRDSDTIFPKISSSMSAFLKELKEKLHDYEYDWDIYKKYTNPYEYVHSNVPEPIFKSKHYSRIAMNDYKKKGVAKYKPLSRAYYKMLEMIHSFYLISNYDGPIKSFHLAEGPGGFIEALLKTRKCSSDMYVGMTLLDDNNDDNIPAWKKSQHFLRENPNVELEYGKDGTGNILSLENLDYCREKYGSSMDIITGDGGFDFSDDYSNQENNIIKLLFAQIVYAVTMQKRGGHFVLKVFDCFFASTVDLLYILSAFYKKVYISKPNMSRYANSEKYVVCKGFLYENSYSFYPMFRKAFSDMINIQQVGRFLSMHIPHYYLTRLEEYNSIFGQQQMETIYSTLVLMENKNTDRIDSMVKSNLQKCIQWCVKYNVDYNPIFKDPVIHESSGETVNCEKSVCEW